MRFYMSTLSLPVHIADEPVLCLSDSSLPQSHHVLHYQADAGDTCPAAETHEERFTAGFYQLDDVGVQSDG